MKLNYPNQHFLKYKLSYCLSTYNFRLEIKKLKSNLDFADCLNFAQSVNQSLSSLFFDSPVMLVIVIYEYYWNINDWYV